MIPFKQSTWHLPLFFYDLFSNRFIFLHRHFFSHPRTLLLSQYHYPHKLTLDSDWTIKAFLWVGFIISHRVLTYVPWTLNDLQLHAILRQLLNENFSKVFLPKFRVHLKILSFQPVSIIPQICDLSQIHQDLQICSSSNRS